MTLRVLKNRYTGETGVSTYLNFNTDTFRLSETDFNFDETTRNTETRRQTDF